MNVTKPQQTVTLTPDEVIAACEAFVRAHHADLDGLNKD